MGMSVSIGFSVPARKCQAKTATLTVDWNRFAYSLGWLVFSNLSMVIGYSIATGKAYGKLFTKPCPKESEDDIISWLLVNLSLMLPRPFPMPAPTLAPVAYEIAS